MFLIRRNLIKRIHRTCGFRGPHALQLLILKEHTELGSLLVVIDDSHTVTLLEIISDEHIVLCLCLTDLTLVEIGKHLLRRHLVIEGGVAFQLLDGEGIIDNMGPVDDGVFEEHLYLIAQKLLVDVPYYRVLEHRHTGVEGVVYQ